MSKRTYLLSGLLLLPLFVTGCAQKSTCLSGFCEEPVVTEIVYKDLIVNQCPKEVSTIVQKNPCGTCTDYPISIRTNSCCTTVGCP